MMRILVTGFGAFPGAPFNPTEAVVRGLRNRHGRRLARAGIDLRTAILPVVYAEVEDAIDALLEQHAPDIVLHLGLAGRRKTISVETRARNRLNTVHPDAARATAARIQVISGETGVRPARWPAERLASAVSREGFAAARSIDAGDYLCNQALYLSLGKHRGLCGFLHIPRLRGRRRIVKAPPPARPTLGAVENSVLAVLRVLSTEHRRHRRQGVTWTRETEA